MICKKGDMISMKVDEKCSRILWWERAKRFVCLHRASEWADAVSGISALNDGTGANDRSLSSPAVIDIVCKCQPANPIVDTTEGFEFAEAGSRHCTSPI